jgi:HAD superfamily hydrolase (TIGR01490 family)
VFTLGQVLSLPMFYLRYRFGTVGIEELTDRLVGFEGIPEETMRAVAADCSATRMVEDLFPDAVELIDRLNRDERTVVFATTSLDFLVEPLARRLNVTKVISSQLDFRNGKTTGGTHGPVCFGTEKRDRVLAYLRGIGKAAEEATFYTDSSHDLPLLREVGRRVLINPDRALRRIAREENWEIRRFR